MRTITGRPKRCQPLLIRRVSNARPAYLIAALHGEFCVPNHGTSLEGDGLPRSQLRERALAKPSELSSTPRKASKRSRSFTPSAQVQEAGPNIKGPPIHNHSKMARQASCSTPSTRCSLHAGRKALSAAPIANFGRPSAPGRIPIDRRLLQPPRHHSALGVVTALSQPFDQLPGVFSQRLARFIAQIMHMAATIDFQLQPS